VWGLAVRCGAFRGCCVQNHWFALGHNENLVLDAVGRSRSEQSFRRLVHWLKAERESSVMHRHQRFCAKLEKRPHRLFRIHVNFAAAWRFIGANRKQSDVDLVVLADVLEPWEVSAVAAMKNGAAVHVNDKPAKVAMQICEKSRAPMMTWRERTLERPEFDRLPVIKLVHNVKTKIVHQISHADWHGNRLIGSHAPQRAPV